MPDSESNEVRPVQLDRLPIELHQFLKFENLVASGGEAKTVIRAGLVKVNAEVETRRGRKLRAGDVISFQGHHYEIAARQDPQ